MIWNPWKRIRELERTVAHRDAEIEFWIDEEKQAREKAFYEAREHFERKTAMLQAHNKQLMERMVTINNMEPRPLYAIAKAQEGGV